MAIITLTTDFGLKDHFVGVLKGAIYSQLPAATIVDISHGIAPFNIQECAYVLKNSYHNFPKGTIHIVGVDSEATEENHHIAVLADGHYFVSANTGVIGLITAEMTPEEVVQIQLPNTVKTSFPVLNVFTPVACHIAKGGSLAEIGTPYDTLKLLREFQPVISDDDKRIVGSVIYIDNYGNVVTNIQKSLFEYYADGCAFELQARNQTLKKIYSCYSDFIDFSLEKNKRKGDGDLLALFNAAGYLELAIYKSNLNTVGGAATLLGLDYRDSISIQFL